MTEQPYLAGRKLRYSVALAVVAIVSAAGCSKGPTKATPLTGSNLAKVAQIYNMYTQKQNSTSLTNEQQLITFAKSLSPEGMKSLGVDVTQVEQYFTSPRDGKPYRIVFKLATTDPANPPVVAYEQVGVGGKREVGFLTGKVEEVDETRFRQLVPSR